MTNCLAQLLELIEFPCQLTVTAPPQLSLVVTPLVSGAGTRLAQLTVRLLAQERLGGLVSWKVMVWVQVVLLMTNRLAQLLELSEPPRHPTVPAPPQLSLVVTPLVSGAGTRLAQLTVRLLVQVMLGGLVSWTVMIWAQVVLLPHRSVAR